MHVMENVTSLHQTFVKLTMILCQWTDVFQCKHCTDAKLLVKCCLRDLCFLIPESANGRHCTLQEPTASWHRMYISWVEMLMQLYTQYLNFKLQELSIHTYILTTFCLKGMPFLSWFRGKFPNLDCDYRANDSSI